MIVVELRRGHPHEGTGPNPRASLFAGCVRRLALARTTAGGHGRLRVDETVEATAGLLRATDGNRTAWPSSVRLRCEHVFAMEAHADTTKCYRCGDVKPAEDFAWRRKARDQRDTFCRPCRSAYGKEHYAAHRERYIEQARIQKQQLRLERTTYLPQYFKAHPCVDCGQQDPVVLEFDHLHDKSFSIGAALTCRNWQSILNEIQKCEVVCANCRRRRTARRRGAVRATLAQI